MSLTFGAFAADQVSSDPINQQPVGTISVQGGSNLNNVRVESASAARLSLMLFIGCSLNIR
jgi:multiple stress resistance protein BhsA